MKKIIAGCGNGKPGCSFGGKRTKLNNITVTMSMLQLFNILMQRGVK